MIFNLFQNIGTMQTCACCGYKSIEEKGNYDICQICFWEDDNVQEADPWFEEGANIPSLWLAQQNFEKYGATEQRFSSNIRAPISNEIKDESWRKLKMEDRAYSTTPYEIEERWGTNKSMSYNYWERNCIK